MIIGSSPRAKANRPVKFTQDAVVSQLQLSFSNATPERPDKTKEESFFGHTGTLEEILN